MFASDSTCCVCRERGKAVQIHHINEDSSNNTHVNLAVLCLECHNHTQTSGGFARELNAPIVTKYRDEWLARVVKRRDDADAIAVTRTIGPPPRASSKPVQPIPYSEDRADAILEYVESLPEFRKKLRAKAKAGWDTEVTASVVEASYEYIDALQGILVLMAGFYPGGTFGEGDPHEFFSGLTASRFRWHWAHAEPDGPGTGGTIVNIVCSGNVVDDVEKMVQNMAESLVGYDDRFDWRGWPDRWNQNTI